MDNKNYITFSTDNPLYSGNAPTLKYKQKKKFIKLCVLDSSLDNQIERLADELYGV